MKGSLVKVYNHEDETAVIVYRDENLEKKKIVKTNMMVDYFLLRQGNSPDVFVKQENCERFETPFTNLINSIVENLDIVDPSFKAKAKNYMRYLDLNHRGNRTLIKNLYRLPGIYGADEPLENRAIEWFNNNFEEDEAYKPENYTAFFDIETDLMADGKRKRDGAIDLKNTPDPINIVSLYYNNIMYVFALDYGDKNKSFTEFINRFRKGNLKSEIIKRVYERNNQPYFRKKKKIMGKEIKLDDIVLRTFKSENDLIRSFFEKLHQLDPDYLMAWNMSFDVKTLFGRLEQTQKKVLKAEGADSDIESVRNYTKDFIADSKYAVNEAGERILPNYFYYISSEGEYTDAKNRRDYCNICDGINWVDQLIVHSILNNTDSNDSDALDEVSNDMFDIGKLKFDLGEDIFNVAWKNYLRFFEYNIQDVMLLKKIETELKNATELFELASLYKCLQKDAFSQTKSTKAFMGYEAKKVGYVLRDNVNQKYDKYGDKTNRESNEFNRRFGLDTRIQMIEEVTAGDFDLMRVMMDRDTFGGFVSDPILNTNKNGVELYKGIMSNKIYGSTFDKDFSSLYPSTKHALSIDDDGAVGRYVIYDEAIRLKMKEKGYDKAYIWKSEPKKSEIEDHWKMNDDGNVEDQNLMIRFCDYLTSKTYSKIAEDFLGLSNTKELVQKLIRREKK